MLRIWSFTHRYNKFPRLDWIKGFTELFLGENLCLGRQISPAQPDLLSFTYLPPFHPILSIVVARHVEIVPITDLLLRVYDQFDGCGEDIFNGETRSRVV